MTRDELTGADPVVGEDGLAQPPQPFKTPRWFKWTIAIAVVGCLVMAAIVFWPGR